MIHAYRSPLDFLPRGTRTVTRHEAMSEQGVELGGAIRCRNSAYWSMKPNIKIDHQHGRPWKLLALTSLLSSARTAPITRPRLLLMALVVPEPSSALIACTSPSSRPWSVGSGDNDVGNICGSACNIDNRTREDMECTTGARFELRNTSVMTDQPFTINCSVDFEAWTHHPMQRAPPSHRRPSDKSLP